MREYFETEQDTAMQRCFQIVRRTEEILLAWSVLLIAGLTIANVATRAVSGDSLAFTGELSQFLIIVVTFVGLSYAAGRGRHIRMTAICDQLSPRYRKLLIVISSLMTAALLSVLAWCSLEYIATVRFLESVSPVLRVPLHLVYLVVPLGLILSAVQYALAVVRNVTSPGVYLSYEVADEYEEPVVGEV
ncbi:MAG: TRAP transporter small permease [Planctomycetaceae bacterium]